MSTERPSEPAAKSGFPRLSWVAAGIAAFASYEIGSLIAFLAAQMKGAPADIGTYGETPHIYFLNKAMTATKPAAIAAAIIALIAVTGAPDTTSGLRANINGIIAGIIAGCVVA